MSKNKSLLSRLELVHPPEAANNDQSTESREDTDKTRKVHVSVKTSKETHDELRRIAYEYRTSIRSVVLEGIEHAIRQYPPKQ